MGRNRTDLTAYPTSSNLLEIDAVEWRRWLDLGGIVLFIEYDVTEQGEIEVVGLINAVEEHGEDADGSDWMAWRVTEFEDDGLGCVGVPAAQLALMEEADDVDALRNIVERIILDDRATKEQSQS